MKGHENLKPIKTTEEAVRRGRIGGIKSGEARRLKKNMRDIAKTLMLTDLPEGNPKAMLRKFGVSSNDLNYQTAIVVSVMKRALEEGDTSSVRLLGELIGDLGTDVSATIDNPIDSGYQGPMINIPDNGRDKRDDDTLSPQAGPQTMFMASKADIVIYGGAAGGGKTYALLLEGLRHRNVNGFGAVIFRSNYTQITAEGGLWDASNKIYGQLPEAVSKKTPKLHWEFPGGGKVHFAHIGCEDDLKSWMGTEIAYLGFDELTHFTKHQFLYMLSRNRSTCGVRPYVRATCNPDSDSWVADFISWWINPDTGYPIPERSGIIRYMTILNDVIYWGENREELKEKYGVNEAECKSVTFIASKLQDNKILMERDPGYLANLKAMAEVDTERLLYGNWKIKASAGKFFKRTQVEMLDTLPDDIVYYCRAWDLAATDEDENGDADYTAGVLYGRRKNGKFVVIDVINQQIKAGDVRKLIKEVALSDRNKYGWMCMVRVPQDPGAAGKIVARELIKDLAGFNVKADTVSGSKEVRATPHAAQWQNGNVQVMRGAWNEIFFSQLESFPESKHDDMVDASSDAFNELANMEFDIDNLL